MWAVASKALTGARLFAKLTRAMIGQRLYPRTPAEISAGVTPTDSAYPELYLRRYGGAPGVGDNSAAMNQAVAVAAAAGGGTIILDTVGEWRMNVVIAHENIWIKGPGGRAEFDVNCIRPYSLASAPITWGDGVSNYRYCGMRDVAVSGTDDPGGAHYSAAAHSAPGAVLVRGGMIGFILDNVWLYNGLRTLSLVSTADTPVTGFRMLHGGARNDLTDSDDARTVYAYRAGTGLSDGYYTDNVFSHTKLNGPGARAATTRGYLIEAEGDGLALELLNCYTDFKTDFDNPDTVCHGVLLKGQAIVRSFGLNLDSGTAGGVMMESTDTLQDIGRYMVGEVRQGHQRFKFAGGSVCDIPEESEWHTYRHRLHTPFLVGPRNIVVPATTTPYATAVNWELQSASGPDRLNGADLEVVKNIRLWGGNPAQAGTLTAVGAGGGVYVAAAGADQNVRLEPSGTGQVMLGGGYTRPTGDNAQDLGGASNRWKVVYAGTGAINTSDARVKQDTGDIPAAWLAAWADVQWQRFRFRDAVAEKGSGARWHVGLIAQRVIEVFAAHGLNALELGIVCHDEWNDEFEDERETVPVLDETGEPVMARTGEPVTATKFTGRKLLVRKAGDLYAIRYDEALALECAYLRSQLRGRGDA